MSTNPRLRRTAVTTLVAAVVLAATTASVTAQDIPSVGVRPLGADEHDPNGGSWFVLEIERGATGRTTAEVVNPADVDQEVSFWLSDLEFAEDGSPRLVEGGPTDVGAWGGVSPRSAVIGSGETEHVDITFQVPDDAEPGDHVGAFVAQTSNLQGDFTVNRRIVKRLYVTVPGDAQRSMSIESIEGETDSWLWPSTAAVTVVLRNDGRIRLRPEVAIRGIDAQGSALLMSRSVEHYVADVPLPWYGGPIRLPVRAAADGGLVRTATRTLWVVPWGLIILIVVAGSAVYAGRRWWKKRKSATAELKQDIQRLEQLITQQAKAQESTAAVGTGLPATELPEDEEAIFLAALKRARRSDDDTALARIALAKHMTSGDGLDLVLEALEKHDGKHRDALIDAAVSYGADALSTHERFDQLSDDTQAELGERLVTAGEPVSGNGNGKPAKVPQPVVGQTDSDVLRNELAKVKGVGPAKQEALVSRFGSLDAIRSAEVADLTDVPGIGYATAREILDQLNG